MSITPDDIHAGAKLIDILLQVAMWLGGTISAAYLAVRWTLRQGVKVGEEKERYENMVEAVEKINKLDLDSLIKTVSELKTSAPHWITKTQHDEMQRYCRSEVDRVINEKLYKANIEWREELMAVNANICHIMGALNIRPVDQGKRRRQTDLDTGD